MESLNTTRLQEAYYLNLFRYFQLPEIVSKHWQTNTLPVTCCYKTWNFLSPLVLQISIRLTTFS